MCAGGANVKWFVTTQDTNQNGSDLRKEDKLKAPNPYGEGAFSIVTVAKNNAVNKSI